MARRRQALEALALCYRSPDGSLKVRRYNKLARIWFASVNIVKLVELLNCISFDLFKNDSDQVWREPILHFVVTRVSNPVTVAYNALNFSPANSLAPCAGGSHRRRAVLGIHWRGQAEVPLPLSGSILQRFA